MLWERPSPKLSPTSKVHVYGIDIGKTVFHDDLATSGRHQHPHVLRSLVLLNGRL